MSAKSTASSVVKIRDNVDHNKVVSVLAVGDPEEWRRQGHDLPKDNVVFMSFDEITEATIENFSPSVIYSPVLAHAFDCIELALLLRHLGFKGEYRAMAQDLPKPDLIEREVSQMCPQLNFKIAAYA
ncbi:MAG: hypothetical protein HKN27_09370 [Silicimonas sp.]|nr:hypothetical protein [Silicimonas sp.]